MFNEQELNEQIQRNKALIIMNRWTLEDLQKAEPHMPAGWWILLAAMVGALMWLGIGWAVWFACQWAFG
jgi:hypothetical protein